MNWYHCVACFFSGVFLANFVPHFVQGISGNRFPTPFANPPGKGLSSPTLNVVWGLANLAVGCGLFRIGDVAHFSPAFTLSFAGAALLSIAMSVQFSKRVRE